MWKDYSKAVEVQMRERVRSSATPICSSEDFDRGVSWGTGTYVSFPSGATAVVTNEHVARRLKTEHLSHLPVPGANFELLREFRVWPLPEDLAASVVPSDRLDPSRVVLKLDDLDPTFEPAPDELLYWFGFPGSAASRHDPVSELSKRYSWFGSLEVHVVSMVSQQVRDWPEGLPAEYNPDYHVAVHYPCEAHSSTGSDLGLPNPAGMSGSLLWDTKAVRCLERGVEWNPSLARVCGVIFATWNRPEIVVATKVEFLRKFVVDVQDQ